MKIIRMFFSENFKFLVVKFSIYLNRRIFVMFCLLWAALIQYTKNCPDMHFFVALEI